MNTDPKKIAARLASQFPKVCGCGRSYATREDWAKLALHDTPRSPGGLTSDAFCSLEWRHCDCGSTLVIEVAIHDLDAE